MGEVFAGLWKVFGVESGVREESSLAWKELDVSLASATMDGLTSATVSFAGLLESIVLSAAPPVTMASAAEDWGGEGLVLPGEDWGREGLLLPCTNTDVVPSSFSCFGMELGHIRLEIDRRGNLVRDCASEDEMKDDETSFPGREGICSGSILDAALLISFAATVAAFPSGENGM